MHWLIILFSCHLFSQSADFFVPPSFHGNFGLTKPQQAIAERIHEGFKQVQDGFRRVLSLIHPKKNKAQDFTDPSLTAPVVTLEDESNQHLLRHVMGNAEKNQSPPGSWADV